MGEVVVALKYTIFESPRRQNFPFPYYLMSYITENPLSPIGYQKLQKTCKYFFAKNKIVCLDKRVWYQQGNGLYYASPLPRYKWSHYEKLPIGKFKYWFTNLAFDFSGTFSCYSQHIYRLTLESFSLTKEKLTLNDANLFLSNKLKKLYLNFVDIRDDNGNSISGDYILLKAPNLTEFTYINLIIIYSNDSLKKLILCKHFKKFQWLHLTIYETSEKIDDKVLLELIKLKVKPYAIVTFTFKKDVQNIKELGNKMENCISKWFPENQKPKVCVEEKLF